MSFSYSIKPGVGIGSITFGMKKEDIIAILGDPEEVSIDKNDDGSTIESHDYWSKNLSFHYDSVVDFKLTSFEVDAEDTEIEGVVLVDLPKADALAALLKIGFEDASEVEEDDLTFLSSEEKEINLWIEDGKVEAVQASVLVDANDQEIWP